MSNTEKLKALQLTLDKLEKSYGKGTIMKLGDTAIEATEVISTGSLGLDIALGVGGLPFLLPLLYQLGLGLPAYVHVRIRQNSWKAFPPIRPRNPHSVRSAASFEVASLSARQVFDRKLFPGVAIKRA